MELHDLIYSRQSVRKFKDTPVPDEDVLKILDAVRVGPSSENEQNWHFIVVRNEEFKRKLGEVITAGQQKISAEVAVSDEELRKIYETFYSVCSESAGAGNGLFFQRAAGGLSRVQYHQKTSGGYR